MGIIRSIQNWLFKIAKDFIIKHIDKNSDGVITPEEILDFAQDLIDLYEDITGEELELVISEDKE